MGNGLKEEQWTAGKPARAIVAGQGSGCGVAEGYKKELTAQLIPEWGGQVSVPEGRGRRAGGQKDVPKDVPKEASWGSGVGDVGYRNWGSASETALWVINSRPSYFLMKVTTDTSA